MACWIKHAKMQLLHLEEESIEKKKFFTFYLLYSKVDFEFIFTYHTLSFSVSNKKYLFM